MKFTPRLRSILIFLNLVTLVLPLVGILSFRLYENELIKQTESNLILQGAVIRETYKSALMDQMKSRELRKYGVEYQPEEIRIENGRFDPIFPSLDLSRDPILLPGAEAAPSKHKPETKAFEVGKKISNILKEAQKVTFSGVRVLDYNGTVVASSGKEIALSLESWPEVQKALLGRVAKSFRRRISDQPPPAIDAISRASRVRIFIALPVTHHNRVMGVVLLSRSPSNILKGLYDNRTKLFTVLALVFAIMLFVVIITSQFLSKPITELKNKTKKIADGDLKTSLEIKNPGSLEVRELAESIRKMTQSLHQRGAYIETFSKNVSHEFKTPITSMKGTIELLKEHFDDMTNEERKKFYDNLGSEVERLNSLVQKLMELAKADVIEPTKNTIKLLKAISPIITRYADQNIEVEVEVRGSGDFLISMDEVVLDSIVSNLLENAIQHGGKESKILISIEENKKGVFLKIKDNGKGISEANQKRIFDSFFTTARDAGGTGLGLSITKSLVEAHGGSIEVSSTEEGTEFKLSFLLAVL